MDENALHFTSTLEVSTNKLWGCHFVVPEIATRLFSEGNDRRVVCTLNGTQRFQCAMLPKGDGTYVITVNKKLRDTLRLNIGAPVQVSLEKDESEYGLPMAEAFAALLEDDDTGNRLFHALTPGKQRTLLYIVNSTRGADAQIEKGMLILEHLKANKGKIDYKQLHESFKKKNRD